LRRRKLDAISTKGSEVAETVKVFGRHRSTLEMLDAFRYEFLFVLRVAEAVKAFGGHRSTLEMLDAFRYEFLFVLRVAEAVKAFGRHRSTLEILDAFRCEIPEMLDAFRYECLTLRFFVLGISFAVTLSPSKERQCSPNHFPRCPLEQPQLASPGQKASSELVIRISVDWHQPSAFRISSNVLGRRLYRGSFELMLFKHMIVRLPLKFKSDSSQRFVHIQSKSLHSV
jgi:hypothetical protein